MTQLSDACVETSTTPGAQGVARQAADDPGRNKAPRRMRSRGLLPTVGPAPGDPGRARPAGVTAAAAPSPGEPGRLPSRRPASRSPSRRAPRERMVSQPVLTRPALTRAAGEVALSGVVRRSPTEPPPSWSVSPVSRFLGPPRRAWEIDSGDPSTGTRGFGEEFFCTGRCTAPSTGRRAQPPVRAHPCGQHPWTTTRPTRIGQGARRIFRTASGDRAQAASAVGTSPPSSSPTTSITSGSAPIDMCVACTSSGSASGSRQARQSMTASSRENSEV